MKASPTISILAILARPHLRKCRLYATCVGLAGSRGSGCKSPGSVSRVTGCRPPVTPIILLPGCCRSHISRLMCRRGRCSLVRPSWTCKQPPHDDSHVTPSVSWHRPRETSRLKKVKNKIKLESRLKTSFTPLRVWIVNWLFGNS